MYKEFRQAIYSAFLPKEARKYQPGNVTNIAPGYQGELPGDEAVRQAEAAIMEARQAGDVTDRFPDVVRALKQGRVKGETKRRLLADACDAGANVLERQEAASLGDLSKYDEADRSFMPGQTTNGAVVVTSMGDKSDGVLVYRAAAEKLRRPGIRGILGRIF